MYDIRYDALGHAFFVKGNPAYDSGFEQLQVAVTKMIKYVKAHPDTIAIITSDQGVQDAKCGDCSGMHGLAGQGNLAYMGVFALNQNGAKLPWITTTDDENRHDWNQFLFDKNGGAYSNDQLQHFEPSPPSDMVMRYVHIASTQTQFVAGMPFSPDSIGVPYGPNVGLQVADSTAVNSNFLNKSPPKIGQDLCTTKYEGRF